MIPKICWIVSETGLTGTENQCLGVAEALVRRIPGLSCEIHRICLRQPWKSFSPWLGLTQDWSFIPSLHAPWPDLLIAAGRKAAAAALHVKKKSGGRTFTAQIQDPRLSPDCFDLLAVPAHDPARGANVIVTTGAPNRVHPDRLTQARLDFPDLGDLPSPRLAVLIGGSTRRIAMTADTTLNLIQNLSAFLGHTGGSLLITASRRTGMDNIAALQNALAHKDNVFFWDGSGQNPYFGLLGWADALAVTADSVSMLSEACTTGKPVYMIPLDGQTRRLALFHSTLLKESRIRPFSGTVECAWAPPPLRDAEMVAEAILERYEEHCRKIQTSRETPSPSDHGKEMS